MKARSLRPGSIVRLSWDDSCGTVEPVWSDSETLRDITPAEIESVGFVITSDDRAVSITTALILDGDEIVSASQPFIIPWGCIRKVKRIA